MTGLLKNGLIFGAGFLVARYILLGKRRDEYVRIEKETIDKIQNRMHEWLKGIYPEADDLEIGETVLHVTTGQSIDEVTASEEVVIQDSPQAQQYYDYEIMNEYATI